MVEAEKILLTKQGVEKLQEEFRNLIDVVRPNVIKDLQEARAQGDLSENADYDAARARQAEVEARIKEIEHILANVTIIDDNKKDKKGKAQRKVSVGSTVTYLDLDDKEEHTVTIVGSVETDPFNGKISNESALGVALYGKEVSDKEIEVQSEVPYKIVIKNIQ